MGTRRRVETSAAVLGVDGCRAGWVGVLRRGSSYDVLVAPAFAELLSRARGLSPGLAVVGVDMPIGLPDAASRRADLLARARLPAGRKSSVFPAPSRPAVEHVTHPEASAANRRAVGVGVSIQAFHLVPKILEVEAVLLAGCDLPVVEVHPEVSFAAMDPDSVVWSKRSAEGAAARRRALGQAGVDPPAYLPGRGHALDDLLDACAVAWTAQRYAAGRAVSLPDPPEVFSDGLPAAIWA